VQAVCIPIYVNNHVKQKRGWAEPIPSLIRVLPAVNLPAKRQPEGDLAPRIPNGTTALETAAKY